MDPWIADVVERHPAAAALADLANKELWTWSCGKCGKKGTNEKAQDVASVALGALAEERRQQDMALSDLQLEVVSYPTELLIAIHNAGQRTPGCLPTW
jgi:hypothetical protein